MAKQLQETDIGDNDRRMHQLGALEGTNMGIPLALGPKTRIPETMVCKILMFMWCV